MNYTYCGISLGSTRYYSPIFTLPATDRHIVSSGIVNPLPEQFKEYVVQKYAEHDTPRNESGCGGGSDSESIAQEQKSRELESYRKFPNVKIVETDYQWTDFSSRQSVTQHLTEGPSGYASCYVLNIDKQTSINTYYVSSIFPIHLKAPNESQDLYDQGFNTEYRASYTQFVGQKYGVRTMGRGTGRDCHTFKSQAEAQADLDRQRKDPVEKVVDTGWSPGGSLGTSPYSASESITPSTSGTSDPDIRAAVEREHQIAPGFCQDDPGLGATYDCTCFADKVLEARTNGQASFAKAAGGRIVMKPQLGALAMDLDLRSCVAPEKVTAYTTKNLNSSSLAVTMPPEERQALAACVSRKMINQMKTDKQGMANHDKYNSQDMTDCNQSSR